MDAAIPVGPDPVKQAVSDGGNVAAGSEGMSDEDAFSVDDAHHHGETCTCNLRGE
jgi:hypothetical protein